MKQPVLKPEIFYMDKEVDREAFDKLRQLHPEIDLIDTLGEQKHELELVRNPALVSHQSLYEGEKSMVQEDEGAWVYFSWRNTAARILSKSEYEELRLSRNKNLIMPDEQNKLSHSKIAVAGLNVGNPGAICIALEGISSDFKLADLDTLSVSNLNRFRAGLPDLGVNKAELSARQIYEINPYANIEMYSEGVSPDNAEAFLNDPRVDILIEEMDNLKLKIAIRQKAKELKIPVLMATGNGENVLVDIERYDLEPKLKILSGYLSEEIIEKVSKIIPGQGTYRERINLARDFMGKKYLDERLVNSFTKVGNTLAGIPQLAESSFLRGAVIAHFVKKILLGEPIPSGRYTVSLDGKTIKL